MNGIIYLARCTVNGKVYVGQTIQDLSVRRVQHCCATSNSLFSKAIVKHGQENFTWEILHSGITTLDELNRLETESISLFDSTNPECGYNGSAGWSGKWGTSRRRGPVPPACGRIRVTVNLPRDLLPFVDSFGCKSRSANIVAALMEAR